MAPSVKQKGSYNYMNIIVFGATGGTGHEVVKQALQQGHIVTAFVRNPAQVDLKAPNLRLVAGDVSDAAAVKSALAQQDAAVVSLGGRKDTIANICTVGTQHVITGLQAHGIRRILVVTSMGVGDSKSQVPFFFRIIMNTMLKQAFADKETQEQAVRASGLDWTLVRPSGLIDAPLTGHYLTGEQISTKQGRIARADVAHFIVQSLQDPLTFGKAVTVTY